MKLLFPGATSMLLLDTLLALIFMLGMPNFDGRRVVIRRIGLTAPTVTTCC